jgi:hypothetical protein
MPPLLLPLVPPLLPLLVVLVESALASWFTAELVPPQATDTAPPASSVRSAAPHSTTNCSARDRLVIARA